MKSFPDSAKLFVGLGIVPLSLAGTVFLRQINEQLRIENARLRAKVEALESTQRIESTSIPPTTNFAAQPVFQYPFLSRSTWTNAGLAHPFATLQTFFWALTSGNQEALDDASARDKDDEPIRLTGLHLNFAQELNGVQVLTIGTDPNTPGIGRAIIISERQSQQFDGDGQPIERKSHSVMELRLQKEDSEWRVAGKFR